MLTQLEKPITEALAAQPEPFKSELSAMKTNQNANAGAVTPSSNSLALPIAASLGVILVAIVILSVLNGSRALCGGAPSLKGNMSPVISTNFAPTTKSVNELRNRDAFKLAKYKGEILYTAVESGKGYAIMAGNDEGMTVSGTGGHSLVLSCQ
jgi:hypothetical protein